MEDVELSPSEQKLAGQIYEKVFELNYALEKASELGVTARFVANKSNGIEVGMAGDVNSFKVYVGSNSDEFWRVINEDA